MTPAQPTPDRPAETQRSRIDEQSPWPGLGTFDETAQRFFNGRRNEAAELRRLVLHAPLTVVFGASGLGKTSLLQAGLFPLLRKENILPVYVRLDVRDGSAPLIDQVSRAMLDQFQARKVDAPAFSGAESLWEWLHHDQLELWSDRNQLLTPLFIFDQFEEVFTLGAENAGAIARLRVDLADVIENRVPAALASRIRASEAVDSHLSLGSQRYKMLISFREDFLPAVEGWKRDLPSIMRNRIRLLPMSGEQAFEAVHTTAPHLADEAIALEIVHFVAAAQQEGTIGLPDDTANEKEIAVEPALLSLVCHGLNERRKAQGKACFDLALLQGTGQTIVSDYYRDAVGDLPERVQRFIEKELLTERGFRKPCDIDDARTIHGVSAQELRLLVDRRLLRIEPHQGTERVELTHDLLTRVVREHRDRQRERERIGRQRKRVLILVALGAGFLALSLVLFGMYQNEKAAAVEAVRQKKIATSEAQGAHRSQTEAEKQRLDAEHQRQSAEQQARIATSRQLAAQALARLHDRFDLALLLSVVAAKTADTSEARNSLLTALEYHPRLSTFVPGDGVGMSFSPDGKKLVWHTREGGLVLWDVATRRSLGALRPGRDESVTSAVFSAESKTVAAAVRETPAIVLWDVAHRKPFRRLSVDDGKVSSLSFSPDGSTLASGSDDGATYLWDAANWQPIGSGPKCALATQSSIAFSPDSKTLARACYGTVVLWDLPAHRPLGQPIAGLKFSVNSVAFSPDGKTLAFADGNGITLWDVAGNQSLGPAVPAPQRVNVVAFSPDGSMLASGGEDGIVKLWEVRNRRLSAQGEPLTGHRGTISAMDFSPDGKILASASADGMSILWDLTSSQSLSRPLLGQKSGVRHIAFSPDGRVLASQGDDKKTLLWDVKSGQPLASGGSYLKSLAAKLDNDAATARSHRRVDGPAVGIAIRQLIDQRVINDPGNVNSVAFSPDSKTVAIGMDDGRIVLWDALTKQLIGPPLAGHKTFLISLAFSPDGRTLASGCFDGSLKLWDVDIDSWQARACRVANRNLTKKEWEQYFSGQPYRVSCPSVQ